MSKFVHVESVGGKKRYVNSDRIQYLEAKSNDWESGSWLVLVPIPAGTQTIDLSPAETQYVLNQLSEV
ncbi:hypothetical protein [Pseudomonas cichorii]|uniref:hypothetical protein n=1 Tax=Pseudomonas cichorii TaxID=36746 RepID=UPI000EFE0C01|nr:hypothetical protein [Pseudomonas cichorii]